MATRSTPEISVGEIFPFFFRLDRAINVVDVGPSLQKIAPDLRVGGPLTDSLEIRSPECDGSYEQIRENAATLWILQHKQSSTLLRGQFVAQADNTLLFVGSLWLNNPTQVTDLGLTFGDFAPHDPALDILHLLSAYERAMADARLPNQLIERFFSMSPNVFSISGFDGKFKLLNNAWTRLLGYSVAESIGKPYVDFVHPADRAKVEAQTARLLAGETMDSFETRVVCKNGMIKYLRWSGSADLENKLIYSNARDISQEVLAQELSTRLVEASPSGMLLVDEQGIIILINAQAEHLFGYEPGELPGQPVEKLVPLGSRETHAHVRSEYSSAPSPRVMARRRDLMGLSKSGREFPVEVALNPVTAAGTTFVLAAVYDIRERKRFEDELRLARDSALELAKAKADFLANMSHEIRTPLNAIIGMSGLLLETSLNESQLDQARTVRTAADTLLSLINDILDYSKIEAGRVELENLPFDLVDIVDEAIELTAPAALAKKLEVRVWVAQDVPSRVIGDPARTRQVLLNLLSNAVKFTSTGFVETRIAVDRELIEIEVADSGIGIPVDAQQRLFTPFTQADSSTTRKFGGTGLGLAISHRFTELMGGSIKVESTLRKGSTFTVSLPLKAPADATPVKSLTGKHVFVETNDPRSRECYVSWLIRAGASVVDERSQSIDAALLDLDEPTARIRASRLPKTSRIVRVALREETSQFRTIARPARSKAIVEALTAPLSPLQKPEAPPAIQDRCRILLVEDSTINQKVATSLLKKLGYSADIAANGNEALAALGRARYDIVLMDCQMPELDGYEATRRWRQSEPPSQRLPIIAMTANAMSGDRDLCLEAGMDHYIAKPVKIDELSAAIEHYRPVFDRSWRHDTARPDEPDAPWHTELDTFKNQLANRLLRLADAVSQNQTQQVAELARHLRADANQIHIVCLDRDCVFLEQSAHKVERPALEAALYSLSKQANKIQHYPSWGVCEGAHPG